MDLVCFGLNKKFRVLTDKQSDANASRQPAYTS
jgi:hypothetical protein